MHQLLVSCLKNNQTSCIYVRINLWSIYLIHNCRATLTSSQRPTMMAVVVVITLHSFANPFESLPPPIHNNPVYLFLNINIYQFLTLCCTSPTLSLSTLKYLSLQLNTNQSHPISLALPSNSKNKKLNLFIPIHFLPFFNYSTFFPKVFVYLASNHFVSN